MCCTAVHPRVGDRHCALRLALNEPPHLATASLSFSGPGPNRWWHNVEIAEFRRPEMEVSAAVLTAGPHVRGETLVAEAEAAYFSGGGLSGAEVWWSAAVTTATWAMPAPPPPFAPNAIPAT